MVISRQLLCSGKKNTRLALTIGHSQEKQDAREAMRVVFSVLTKRICMQIQPENECIECECIE